MMLVDSNHAADVALRAARSGNNALANIVLRSWLCDPAGHVDEGRALGLLNRWTEPPRRWCEQHHKRLYVNLDGLPATAGQRRDDYVTACTLLVAFTNRDPAGAALLLESLDDPGRLSALRAALNMVARGAPGRNRVA